jgi:hypothetical protein
MSSSMQGTTILIASRPVSPSLLYLNRSFCTKYNFIMKVVERSILDPAKKVKVNPNITQGSLHRINSHCGRYSGSTVRTGTMERKNSDNEELLRRISRDRLLEINVKLTLDALCLCSVIRLHSQNQSPSFHDRQAILTGVNRITAFAMAATRACRPSICVPSKRMRVPPTMDGTTKRPSTEKVLGNWANASFFWITSSDALATSGTMPLTMLMTLSASLSETFETSWNAMRTKTGGLSGLRIRVSGDHLPWCPARICQDWI